MSRVKSYVLSSPLESLSLDSQYYLLDAVLYFQVRPSSHRACEHCLSSLLLQVEQTIFRVHGYFFTRESPKFRERMAGVECARSGAHDGTTDRTAVPVKDISAEDFSKFLWIFYDPYVSSTIA